MKKNSFKKLSSKKSELEIFAVSNPVRVKGGGVTANFEGEELEGRDTGGVTNRFHGVTNRFG